MSAGYSYTIDGIRYVRKDRRPAGLGEVWAEVYGVGNACIYRPDGSLMLRDAGSVSVRSAFMRQVRLRLRGFGSGKCGRCGSVRYVDQFGPWCRRCGAGAAR